MLKSLQSFLNISSLKYEKLQTKFQTIFIINQSLSILFFLFQSLQTETKIKLLKIKTLLFFIN